MTQRPQQPRLLDESLPEAGERQAHAGECYAQVVVDQPGRAVDREFTYSVPGPLHGAVRVGSFVLVPFGPRRVPGWVTGLPACPPAQVRVRPIAGLIVDEPVFTEQGLEVARWIARHYLCPLRDALRCLLPPGAGRDAIMRISLTDAGRATSPAALGRARRQQQVLAAVQRLGGEVELTQLQATLGEEDPSAGPATARTAVAALEGRGLVRTHRCLAPPRVRELRRQVARLAGERDWAEAIANLQSRAPRQAETLCELLAAADGVPVTELSRAAVRALAHKGLVTVSDESIRRRPQQVELSGQQPEFLPLTPDQQSAFDQIEAALRERRYRSVLLHGVTGSGKTEVYLHAINAALRRGRGAIVLVPEIALTPQMVGRFRARFGERLALLHSGLSDGERFDEWRRIERGAADLVVGARSAIFAPLPDIGAIVIDEEHERAYKQDGPPRYHALEVARLRARQAKAVLVLGSATPSLESYYAAEVGQSQLSMCHLPARIDDRPLPEVEIIDMRGETRMGRGGTFSQRLLDALADCLGRGEQALLFLNRRGFSTFVMCRDCGFTLRCADCSVSLIYYHETRAMRCHHCDLSVPVPQRCPSCDSEEIGFHGLGTERVADQVAREFAHARVLRMDRDTTARKGAYADILSRFCAGEANVLIGTQMIAKGHDFPEVTLVGVLNADTGLNRADFRASEHTFQLLTQVAGRAGRADKPGRVLVQTYNPQHVAITSASRHDYAAFYADELAKRRENMYPPFARLINLTIADRDGERALRTARTLAYQLQQRGLRHKRGPLQFVGPAAAPLAKLRGRYRYHLLLKGPTIEELRDPLLAALEALGDDVAHVMVDVDPLDMM
ncbi:MAG: primosomal protein N' [Armatimonadota bacterium]